MQIKIQRAKKAAAILLLAMLVALACISLASAQQTGASVENVSHSTKTPRGPDNRSDEKGTINVLRLTGVQQNTKWKAYESMQERKREAPRKQSNSGTMTLWKMTNTLKIESISMQYYGNPKE